MMMSAFYDHESLAFELGGHAPAIHPTAWVAPTAIVIGDVAIGERSGIWFNVVLRGDCNSIRIGARSNIQDNTVVHVDPGRYSAEIGDDVTIGHHCTIHGCTLMNSAFVGMGAIVMNGAVVESGGAVAAGALVAEGKTVRTGELWAGVPARLLRTLRPEEVEGFASGARAYVKRLDLYESLRKVSSSR